MVISGVAVAVAVEDYLVAVAVTVTVTVIEGSVDWKSEGLMLLVACDRRLQGYLNWRRELGASGAFFFFFFSFSGLVKD